MLWIDPSNAQIGDIAHGADGERNVKTRHRLAARRALQRADSLLPPRSVVIFRVETFLPGSLEELDHRTSLRHELLPLDPRRSVPIWF